MKGLFFSLLIGLLVLLTSNSPASENYESYQHRLFTMQVPSKWSIIPRKQLNELISEQTMKQGLSGEPNWQVYECGFQRNPLTQGLSLPLITIKVDADKDLSRSIRRQLNSMNEDQIAFTYSEAAKVLTSRIAGKLLGFQ
jgi:hypothetical protein